MKITNEVLENAKKGLNILLANPNINAYIGMREREPKYIDFIVERKNYYYSGSNDDSYVYWDTNVYGFTFSAEIFKNEDKTNLAP